MKRQAKRVVITTIAMSAIESEVLLFDEEFDEKSIAIISFTNLLRREGCFYPVHAIGAAIVAFGRTIKMIGRSKSDGLSTA